MNFKKFVDIYNNFYTFAHNIKLRKDLRDEVKACTKEKGINHKDFWKKYDSHYCSVFHNFYYEKTGIDSKYFIPSDFYYTKIDKYFNNWTAGKYLDDKTMYDKLFKNIKQPKLIAKRINNNWIINDSLVNFNEVKDAIISNGEVVLKIAKESSGGSGVIFINSNNINEIQEKGNDIVIQEVIKQSQELNKLCNTSINTIRVMTFLYNNKVYVLSSAIRFGLNGSRVDNFCAGGASCGIEDSGRLKSVAYTETGDKFYCNPNNNIPFNEIVIPNFKFIKELAKKCHESFPYFGLISWDFALNEKDEPVFIEGNFKYGGVEIHQLNNGPLFGDRLEEILKIVCTK